MKRKITILAMSFAMMSHGLIAQPLVYNQENTGTACAPPPLPAIGGLGPIVPLPDPFLWANGSGRSTSFADWECRRNEIKQQIENYEIGIKPPKPDDVSAVYTPAGNPATGGTLVVTISRNGQTMMLTSAIALPAGFSGPYPAIIGMNSASGSVPDTVFTKRGIARITYSHDQVTTYNSPANTNPFYRLYPEYNIDNSGQYSAWAWGVSRLIDGLELVQANLPIKLDKLGVTGCSYAGKMALFAGAFDERIALTIAQESGGGGAPAWRVSHNIEPDGTVEKIDNTSYQWFKNDMIQFAGDNVYKLPHDHHELMAMVAPRALLVTGNTDFTWLSNQAAYITARATKSVYNTLGISERMGFYIDGGHGHCAIPAKQIPAVQAFVDKFLADIPNVITDTVTVNPFPNLDYERWYKWWGTGRPILPPASGGEQAAASRIWLEAECATVGAQWQTGSDAEASKGMYAVPTVNHETAPNTAAAATSFQFVVDQPGSYNVFARINPSGTDYSYWTKVDGGAYEAGVNQLIKNPGFEDGQTNWTTGFFFNSTRAIVSKPDSVHAGNNSLRVSVGNAFNVNYFVQYRTLDIATTIGKQYEVSYWVQSNVPGKIAVQTAPSGFITSPESNTDGTWKQVKWTFTANLASTQIQFLLGTVSNVSYYIDDVTMKEVGGTEWIWTKLKSNVDLSAGAHTVSIASQTGSAKLDKILVTTSADLPAGKGVEGTNCPCPQLGNTLFVNAAINNSSSTGASWSCAMPQLSTAIAYANTHPEIKAIWVAKGTYKPGNTRASSFTITRSDLVIMGGFDGSETEASAANPAVNRTILSSDIGVTGTMTDNCYHAFVIRGVPATGTLEISGFEVRDGYADLSSGGNHYGAAALIYSNNAAANIVFRQMKFINNYAAAAGGAFYLDRTNIKVYDSKFSNNSSVIGGAIFSFFSSPWFTHTVFEDNSATQTGGAFYSNFGIATFNKSAFAYNSSAQAGGAVYQNQANAVYLNSVFVSNHSVHGGAVYQHNNSNSTIVNATFFANSVSGANANGGALILGYAVCKADISNSIFYQNSKAGLTNVQGADIFNFFPAANSNSSFKNNILQTGTWVPADNGGTIAANLRGVNPMFVNAPIPGGGDLLWATTDDGLQLSAGSPAINSGSNLAASNAGLTEDIMDNPRMCGTVDMGAYEFACDITAPASRSNTRIYKSDVPANTGLVVNPFSNDLQIRYSGTEKCAASIFDGNGRAIVTGRSMSQGVNHVNAGSWNRGIYQVVLVTQSGKHMLFKAMKL